jgi:hypothetical protein
MLSDDTTQRLLIAASLIPPVVGICLIVLVDARVRHVSRSKVSASSRYNVALWSLSAAAAALHVFTADKVYMPAIGMGIYSALMVAVFFLAPLLHQRAGFVPPELQATLRGMAGRQPEVLAALRSHFEHEGLKTHDGKAIGCTLLAVAGKVDAKAWFGKQRRYRVFVNLQESAGDLDLHAQADVKEYIISESWEKEVTTTAIQKLDHFLSLNYGRPV